MALDVAALLLNEDAGDDALLTYYYLRTKLSDPNRLTLTGGPHQLAAPVLCQLAPRPAPHHRYATPPELNLAYVARPSSDRPPGWMDPVHISINPKPNRVSRDQTFVQQGHTLPQTPNNTHTMNSSTSRSTSSTSTTSRYSLLAHEFDTLSPAPDDPPILEREDNSDLSTPAETLQSSPVSSFTSFSTTFPTSPEDNTHKQPVCFVYPVCCVC